MSPLAHLLDDCLLPLFILTTALLTIGCGSMCLMRSPAHRQRTGELTLAAIFAWWLLACLPLPRLLPEHLWTDLHLHFRAAAPPHEGTPGRDPGAVAWPMSEPETGSFTLIGSDEAAFEDGQLAARKRESTVALSLDDALAGLARPEVDASSSSVPRKVAPSTAPLPVSGTAISRITIVYLAGAAGCVLWLACGRIRLTRLRRAARRPPGWLAEMFAGLADEAGVRPLLVVSRQSTRPISWGTWSPTIVLPLALARRRHRERLRMVLLHEVAHVVRRDGWGNGLLCLALPLLYMHPLFWRLRGQMRMAAELLADDWAAERGGKLDYVEQLVSLARSSVKSPALLPLAGAVTLYSSSSQFYRRMQMLISRTCPLSAAPTVRWRLSSVAVAALIAVTAASLAGMRPASGQQPPSAGDAATSQPDDPKTVPVAPVAPLPAVSGKAAQPDRPIKELPLVGRLVALADGTSAEARTNTEEEALRAKLAAAEERIRLLEAQLKGAGANPAATPASGDKAPEQRNAVTLTRVGEDGSISIETWTTGEDGRLEKLVSKAAAVDRKVPELRNTATLTRVGEDGLILHESWTIAEDGRLDRLVSKKVEAKPQIARPKQAKKVMLARVAEDGSISHETWTTGEDGRLDKLISKEVETDSPIAGVKTATLPDGRVIKEFKSKDGTVTTKVYGDVVAKVESKDGTVSTRADDRHTGRRLEAGRSTRLADPTAAKSADTAEPAETGADDAVPGWSRGPSIGLDRRLPATTGGESGGLDLVKLATAYADAVGAVEEAEAKVAAGGPESNLAPARVALRNAQRKQELLHSLASLAAEAARADLERVQESPRGGASAEAAAAAQSRLKMLNAILQTRSTGSVDPKQQGESPKAP